MILEVVPLFTNHLDKCDRCTKDGAKNGTYNYGEILSMNNQLPYNEFFMDPGLQLAELGPQVFPGTTTWPHQFSDAQTPGVETGAGQHHQQHDWASPELQPGVAGLDPPPLPAILDTEAEVFLWSHELRDAQTPAVETGVDKRYQHHDWASPKLLPRVRIMHLKQTCRCTF